ncbi:type VI secretion system membrane subunit TssM [Massilia dura]|uniref:Type VI secretion system membrane subunit TssM n=1 Tax=Pseudoduganella dura TaxID=321982 RepID=A0A6I3XF29_9BURK|nr:type VI secretion system membrane subunit TssM [Pseudoduganella dura]
MQRIWLFLTDSRHLAILGLVAMAGLYYLGAELMELALIWVIAATCATVLLWLLVRWLRRLLAARRTARIERAIEETTEPAAETSDDVDVLRTGLLKAIETIRGSRLGIRTGSRALYELPWYMIIGNPAAGKSSAVVNSGLQFPIADGKVVQGVGGTRNCDWFFTTEGIVLDTAGRYSVDDEHRGEWHGFLDLLKKHRARAPVNGILIAVSIAELRGADADAGLRLARCLRKRVQDLIERLEVFAPVYVVFTKADLIAGFAEFFAPFERAERERPWGATMPYRRKAGAQEILAFFDSAFDELHEGLKETCIANMTLQRRGQQPSGIFTFPLEFSSLRVPLRAFLATLFEDNAFQFKPMFRGFYFTSALQEGAPVSAQSHRVAERFALLRRTAPPPQHEVRQTGYFLQDLFRKVIFEDRNLVSQYASRSKIQFKYGAFVAVAVALGVSLAGWSWSYLGNRQLLAAVQGDLDKVVRLQDGRLDLQSRLEALEVLQQRIGQLEKYRQDRPWALSLGLYQGGLLERKLREEYFGGVREVMVKPVAANLEALLYEMNANAAQLAAPAVAQQQSALQPTLQPAQTPARAYADASPTNVEDAYNALKTYLMLADPAHAEPGHLNDQLTRFWRGWLEANRGTMPREQMIRSAERLMTFHLAQLGDPSWPRIEQKLALVDTARENLRRVVRGMPARDRVYAEIRARAATRFPAMTVGRIVGEQDAALVQGSHAVSGTFTREAWEKYVAGAIRDVSAKELQSTDWVLKTASRDDLTLEGSPEQIEKNLVDMYKADYTREWQKFVQGVAIADMNGFNGAVAAMNRLGDPQASPIARLLNTIHEQTAWDNPGAVDAQVKEARTGFVNWIRTRVMQRAPTVNANVNVNIRLGGSGFGGAAGPIGREFAPVARIVGKHDKDASLLRSYLDTLSRLRTRLNGLKNQGDPGPGAKAFMQQTLEGSGSELADALRFVDEQMLNGISDTQKAAVRPLLVRPLMQTFAVIVGPAEAEINKTWLAQVYEPFNRTLAGKYPFSQSARIEASQAEIAQFFGPEGLVAKFVNTSMGPLVVRRGDVLAPRTWADMGITLQPQAVQRFPGWVAVAGAGPSAATAQTVFQILPVPSPGTIEYTVEIDGQQLRYRNTPPQWTSMVHPAAQGVPGARVSAVAFDGRNVELFNEAGQFGLKRLIEAATKKRKEGSVHELRWSADGLTVAVDLRITSSPAVADDAATPQQGFTGMRLPETIVGGVPPAPAAAPVVAQAMAPATAGGAQ